MTIEPSGQSPESQPSAAPPAPPISRLAIASLVCGIVSVVGLLQGILLLFLYGHADNIVQVEACFMLLAGPLGLLLGIAVRLDIWTSAEESASRRVAAWGIGVSCVPCLLITAHLVSSMFVPLDGHGSHIECQNNIIQLCKGAISYSADYRGRLPPADSWPEELIKGSYIHDELLLCPAAPDAGRGYAMNARLQELIKGSYIHDELLLCPAAPEAGRGYAMNARLRGLEISDIRRRTSTVLFFECAPGSPPAGGPELLPPQPRHKDRNGCFVFGFADGHTEGVSPKDLGQLNWDPKAE